MSSHFQSFPPEHVPNRDVAKYHVPKVNANVVTSQHIVTEIS